MKAWFLAVTAALLLVGGVARAGEVVRVGGYDFPPFVENEQGTPKGVVMDLIEVLNKAQSKYEFKFVSTSARRRYADVAEGRFDLLFFESPEWEWNERAATVDFSNVFLTGGEVYIAASEAGRGQDWFDNLKGKRIVGILGYHYGFAGFDADPARLAADWNMKLVNSHRSSIEMVLAGRMDVAVVTDAYLWNYLRSNADASRRLLVSDRYDQKYNHRVLVRRGSPVKLDEINQLLARLEQDGTLPALWQRTGVVRKLTL